MDWLFILPYVTVLPVYYMYFLDPAEGLVNW
jgi:hypothetical protein